MRSTAIFTFKCHLDKCLNHICNSVLTSKFLAVCDA
uniref:Uncharacterized protein n=1 Tax=Anguilla anguilla TaxID=7936 RepID=A0A0E9SID2_ANGAN